MIFYVALGLWLIGMGLHLGVLRHTYCELRWEYRFPQWTRAWLAICGGAAVMFIRRSFLFWYYEMGGDAILGPHSLLVVAESAFFLYGFSQLGILFHRELDNIGVPLANIVIDEHSVIQSWCAAAENLFGWTATEVLGKTLMQTIMPSDEWEDHRSGLAKFFAGTLDQDHQLPRTLLVYAKRKDGLLIRVEIGVSAFPLAGGGWHFHGTVRRLVDL